MFSIPTFLNYDALAQNYEYEIMNKSYLKLDSIEECIQKPESTWSININHWYTTIISYIIPSFVLIVCYMRIIYFMNNKNINLNESSVRVFFFYF